MISVHVPRLSRRDSLKTLAAAGLCATAGASPSMAQGTEIKDEDIFQFALNLEYMETEYYLRASTGKGIDAADAGSGPGALVPQRLATFEGEVAGESQKILSLMNRLRGEFAHQNRSELVEQRLPDITRSRQAFVYVQRAHHVA